MNIVSKITDKGMYLRQRMYIKKKTKELDFLIKNRTSKNRIYFFCTPSTVILETSPAVLLVKVDERMVS